MTTHIEASKPRIKVKEEDKLPGGSTFCWICSEPNLKAIHFQCHRIKVGDCHQCIFCSKKFASLVAFALHTIEHRDYDQPKECLHCSLKFKSRAEYTEHVFQHKRNIDPKLKKIFICDFCNAWQTTTKNSRYHILVSHRGANRCKVRFSLIFLDFLIFSSLKNTVLHHDIYKQRQV